MHSVWNISSEFSNFATSNKVLLRQLVVHTDRGIDFGSIRPVCREERAEMRHERFAQKCPPSRVISNRSAIECGTTARVVRKLFIDIIIRNCDAIGAALAVVMVMLPPSSS